MPGTRPLTGPKRCPGSIVRPLRSGDAARMIQGVSTPRNKTTIDQDESPEQRNINRSNHLRTIYGIKHSSRRKQHTSPSIQMDVEDFTQPLEAGLCINRYRKQLAAVERDEISECEVVYYLGKRRPVALGYSYNFDDEEGDLKVYAHDQIGYRYEVITIIGKGSFGQVFKAYDHKLKENVALKIIKNKPKYTTQAQVQTKLLKFILNQDPNHSSHIIQIRDDFYFRGHVCLTFELLHQNLYEFIKQHKFCGFSLDLIRRFAIQILKALLFLRKHNIIHCDLKPENVLLRQQNKSGIKVIDLGSSCRANQILYTYIQSRFYRAPQIILGVQYTQSIDIWSFGCILCQLFTGQPIFPGQDQNQQMGMFVQLLGNPPKTLIDRAKRRKFFDDSCQLKPQQAGGKVYRPGSKSIRSALVCKDKLFLDLVQRCLEWDPARRITASQALMHKWIVDSLPADIRAQHIEFMHKQGYELAV